LQIACQGRIFLQKPETVVIIAGMSTAYTQTLSKLIEEFAKLPGIGNKTAERLAFYILKAGREDALALADAIVNVKTNLKHCLTCMNLSEGETCDICADARRDKSVICVVEAPKDLMSLEKTGQCKWVYHVLGGHIAPLEGVEPSDLNIDSLLKRVRAGAVKEIVMATNPNMDGDATALYLTSLLRPLGVQITRLARGLPSGSSIEYSGTSILTEAILGRSPMD
jgi:recombination protein RecR